MKTLSMTSLVLLLATSLVACEGPEGPAGEAGPAGQNGNDGSNGTNGTDGTDGTDGTNGMDGMDGAATIVEVSGTVASSVGAAGEGTPVALVAIDDTGAEIVSFGGTLTDANGAFSLSVDDDVVASTRLVLISEVDGEGVSSALFSDTAVTIDPVSTGVLSAMLLITETPDGRTLSDYTPAEFSTLYAAADTALTTASTDLSDPQAVLDEIIASVGGQLADLSEGTYTPLSTGITAPGVPTDASVAHTFSGSFDEYDLVAGDGATFDIQTDGELDNGTSGGNNGDACDDCFVLRINGTTFTAGLNAQVEDASELVVGPTTIAGLDVTRKIYVDPAGPPIIRYTDILVNNSAAPITVDIDVASDYGADGSGGIINTSSGDTTISAADQWFYLNDSGSDALVAQWFGTGITSQTGNTSLHTVSWDGVVVPANGQVTLIYFGALYDDGTMDATVEATLMGLPNSAFAGLAPADFNTAINTSSFIMDGEAGAVGPFSTVTANNVTASIMRSTTAASDGSFSMAVPGATGDSVTLTATDGTNDTTITLP